MAEHRILVFFIPEGYIIKLDIAFYVRNRDCIRSILDIRFNGKDLKETFVSGITVLELFRKIDQFFDGLCKVIYI